MNRHYHRPPNWPPAPEGWTPPHGWIPDPGWPAPPFGWVFWTVEPDEDEVNAAPRRLHIPTQRRAVEEWAWQGVSPHAR